jgi:hypothetical protein
MGDDQLLLVGEGNRSQWGIRGHGDG